MVLLISVLTLEVPLAAPCEWRRYLCGSCAPQHRRTGAQEVLGAGSSWVLCWDVRLPRQLRNSKEINPKKKGRSWGFHLVWGLFVFKINPGVIFISLRSCRLPEMPYIRSVLYFIKLLCVDVKKKPIKARLFGRYVHSPCSNTVYLRSFLWIFIWASGEIYLFLLPACKLFKSVIIKISTVCMGIVLKMSFSLVLKLITEKR